MHQIAPPYTYLYIPKQFLVSHPQREENEDKRKKRKNSSFPKENHSGLRRDGAFRRVVYGLAPW